MGELQQCYFCKMPTVQHKRTSDNYRQKREKAFKFFGTFPQIDETSQIEYRSD